MGLRGVALLAPVESCTALQDLHRAGSVDPAVVARRNDVAKEILGLALLREAIGNPVFLFSAAYGDSAIQGIRKFSSVPLENICVRDY